VRHVVFAACLCVLAGCSGETGQTIEGKVTFSDGKPLGQGYVVLSDGTHSYNGAIKSDGTYKAENVLAGEYKVGFGGVTLGGTDNTEGYMEYDKEGNYIPPPEGTPAISLIKVAMCNPDTSGLTVKVPSDSYDVTVEAP